VTEEEALRSAALLVDAHNLNEAAIGVVAQVDEDPYTTPDIEALRAAVQSYCACGHGIYAHYTTSETDLDGRSVGGPYETCAQCVNEDRIDSAHHFFVPRMSEDDASDEAMDVVFNQGVQYARQNPPPAPHDPDVAALIVEYAREVEGWLSNANTFPREWVTREALARDLRHALDVYDRAEDALRLRTALIDLEWKARDYEVAIHYGPLATINARQLALDQSRHRAMMALGVEPSESPDEASRFETETSGLVRGQPDAVPDGEH
jgi:hypothetical protein